MSGAVRSPQQRIEEQEVWTFEDCLGLASEFNMKPRMIIAMVMAAGKQYRDGDLLGTAEGKE